MLTAHRPALAVAVAGLAMLGMLAALPENFVLRNTSLSMLLGWYVMLPFAEPVTGAIVAFPVPAQARDLADKACIKYPLLKRVIYRHPNGELYLAGDHGGARSFDSRYYGAVPETSIIGVYTLVVERDPGTREGTQDKPLRSEEGSCAAGSAKDDSHLRGPGETREPTREDPGTTRTAAKW